MKLIVVKIIFEILLVLNNWIFQIKVNYIIFYLSFSFLFLVFSFHLPSPLSSFLTILFSHVPFLSPLPISPSYLSFQSVLLIFPSSFFLLIFHYHLFFYIFFTSLLLISFSLSLFPISLSYIFILSFLSIYNVVGHLTRLDLVI